MNNVLYAQSGGVTPVINNSARGVVDAFRASSTNGHVYAARFGIVGALAEDLINVSQWPDEKIHLLGHTPGGAFGSCRFKLRSMEENREQYERLVEVCKAHDIRYFLYNGGGDSADTALKVSQMAQSMDLDLTCVGIPKTVDNDLPLTDACPGFGSAARYLTLSLKEATMDVASMAQSSTKVFIMEAMGRHAGWLAAATGVLRNRDEDAPHIILLPEVTFDASRFLKAVQSAVECHGFCCVVASEGTQDADGNFLTDAGNHDAFGHVQLGGLAPYLADMVTRELDLKTHWAVPDYLQRSARHAASRSDWEQAYAVGEAAMSMALAGKNAKMPIIRRLSDEPYSWDIIEGDLSEMANIEKKMPTEYISTDGYGITEDAKRYFRPLMAEPAPLDDLPMIQWPDWPLECVPKKLKPYSL